MLFRAQFGEHDVWVIPALAQFFASQAKPLPAEGAAGLLLRMISAGLDRLPLPGHGATLLRWQMLAAVAAHDLSLLKLYEGHTDAEYVRDALEELEKTEDFTLEGSESDYGR